MSSQGHKVVPHVIPLLMLCKAFPERTNWLGKLRVAPSFDNCTVHWAGHPWVNWHLSVRLNNCAAMFSVASSSQYSEVPVFAVAFSFSTFCMLNADISSTPSSSSFAIQTSLLCAVQEEFSFHKLEARMLVSWLFTYCNIAMFLLPGHAVCIDIKKTFCSLVL